MTKPIGSTDRIGPARRTQKDKINLYLKRQVWILFIFIIIAAVIDIVWLHSQLTVAKSAALGALLSVIAQSVFTKFVFRHTGYRARKHIVSQLFRGHSVKWLLTISGFALIFIFIMPISAPALFAGFMIMQLSHSLMLFNMR